MLGLLLDAKRLDFAAVEVALVGGIAVAALFMPREPCGWRKIGPPNPMLFPDFLSVEFRRVVVIQLVEEMAPVALDGGGGLVGSSRIA